jgi:hypothetical protein
MAVVPSFTARALARYAGFFVAVAHDPHAVRVRCSHMIEVGELASEDAIATAVIAALLERHGGKVCKRELKLVVQAYGFEFVSSSEVDRKIAPDMA